jgi:hypothetical protein
VIQSIEISDRTIRVSFERVKSKEVTADLHEYYLWAPLPSLKSGEYVLEVYETSGKVVMLKQPWKVSSE